MSAWRTIRTHTWVVQHWVILCPQSVNRMLITIQSSLTVPFLALQSVRHVTSSSMSLLSLKDRGKVPDQGEPGVWKRQDKEFQWNRLKDQSFFLFFLQLLFLSFFPCSEKWQSSFLITVFLSCVLSNGAQLWWPISFGVLQPRGLMGGELSACFHPSLIQNHDWSSTTPRSSYLPRAVDPGIWRTLQETSFMECWMGIWWQSSAISILPTLSHSHLKTLIGLSLGTTMLLMPVSSVHYLYCIRNALDCFSLLSAMGDTSSIIHW